MNYVACVIVMSARADLYDQQRFQRDADRMAKYTQSRVYGTGYSKWSEVNTGTVK